MASMLGDMNGTNSTPNDGGEDLPPRFNKKTKPAKRVFNSKRLDFIARVRAAYEALLAENDPAPSERAVRKRLGGASPTDINAALKLIRGELWCRHEPVVFQTRYTGEHITSDGETAGSPVDDPTVGT